MDLSALTVSAAVATIAAALAPFVTALFTNPNMDARLRRLIAGAVAIVLGAVVAVATGLVVGVPPELVAWLAQLLITVAIVISLAQGFYAQSKVDDALRNAANAATAVDAARAQLAAQVPGGTEREAARARVDQARAQLANARARAALLTLTAPAAGTVLTRKAEPGDVAAAGKVLLELADAGETRIYATVDEKNLRFLKIGQKAGGVADAFPGQPFDAELYYLAPAVDPQRGTVEIRFRVGKPPAFLRPDMTVSVETVTGHKDSTLVLPAEAVREADSPRPWVLAVRDGVATRVDVGIGLAGIGQVEITSGLADGDQAILPASGALEGDKVRVRPPRKPKVGGLQVPQGMTK